MKVLMRRPGRVFGGCGRCRSSPIRPGESDIAQGVWSYDAATKRYALTLKGETTTYTLLSRGDPVTCILYKGHLDSADLRASWFSFPTSEESPD